MIARMKRVVIESPLSGNWDRNIRYARLCMVDSFRRGEAPYASHLLYPFILNDEIPFDRKLGMQAGFAWGEAAELAAVYIDLGDPTPGMRAGIDHHQYQGTPIEFRYLSTDLMELLDKPAGNAVRPTKGFHPDAPKPLSGEELSELARLLYRVSWNTQDAAKFERLHGRILELSGPVPDLGDAAG